MYASFNLNNLHSKSSGPQQCTLNELYEGIEVEFIRSLLKITNFLQRNLFLSATLPDPPIFASDSPTS